MCSSALKAVVIQNAARGSQRDGGECGEVVSATVARDAAPNFSSIRSLDKVGPWLPPQPGAKRGPMKDERYKSVKRNSWLAFKSPYGTRVNFDFCPTLTFAQRASTR